MLPLLVLLTAAPAMPAGLEFIENYDNGADGISGLNGAEAVTMSPDGAHVYAAGLESDAVTAFARNATTGELTFIDAYVDDAGGIDGLNGARAVTVSPDGKNVYAAGYQDGAVAVFSRDAGTGALTFVQAILDGSGSATKLGGAHGVTVSPNGAYVFVAGNIDDAVTVFRRDATTGMLTFVEQHADGSGGTNRLDGAETIALSPDGKHVYVAAEDDDAVNVFSLNATTGALTLVEVKESGVGGVTGLNQVHGVTLSPDGAHVYTAAGIGASVAVFARNATTGALTFVEHHQDGVAGVQGLDGAETVVVSPNGALLYATGDLDDALVVFTRNATTGALTFVEYHTDGSHGVGGLDDAEGLTVSPDGAFVYVSGEMDDALVLFGNRCGNGTLEADEACDDGNPLDGDCCSSVCGTASAGTACAGDGNGCTDDACNGAGICLHVNNSAPCDDGAFCTVSDVCQDGACQGAPRNCSAAGDQCNVGVCNETIDACVPQPVSNGTGCNDGNACTQSDACTAGACVGANPVVCTALDQCHVAGTCNPGTGLCSNPVKANGTGCNDGNACTQSDACTAGACVGANPVVCTALDQCHAAGTCHPGTGLCSNPAMADGTGCDDGNACTQTDACVAGICAGADPVICTALDCCHAAGTCDPGTGLCSNPAMADGTECEDGNACTRSDACMAGVCVGANPMVCKALDQCHDAGQCDPETGTCSNPAKADGALCDIPDLCVENGICIEGACVGEATADEDGDGVCNSIDLCPQFPNPDQWDMNHNGIGDQCECNADAPGRCLAGGGSARTDCLVEFAPVGPPSYNRKGTKVKQQLTCKDGDPTCDMDGARDGRCTFGMSICIGNDDPRFANCNPAMVYSVEVMTPRPDRITPPMNYVNARRLELAAKQFGLEVRRRNRAISKFGLGDGDVDITPVCGPAFELMVPAPKPKARQNAIKRRFRINAESVDGRHDGDRFLLICK